MKIKYLDKNHKKVIAEYVKPLAAIMVGTSILATPVIAVLLDHYNKSEIWNTPYLIENNESYKLGDIYVLYKEDEIRLCRCEQEIKNIREGVILPLGVPVPSNSYDCIYKFYDIKTNEMVESIGDSSSKGYEIINLGKELGEVTSFTSDKVNQEYIDNYIENKRFLGR